MPRVPVIPQQELRPLSGVQMQAPATGLATLVQGVGAVADVALRQQQERDAERVMAVEARLKSDSLAHEASVRERRGTNAWGVAAESTKWWNERKDQYWRELENPEQQRTFERVFTDLRTRSLDSIARHEADERRQATADAATASIAGSIDAAAADPTPDRVDGARRDIQTRTVALAQLHGHTPERRLLNEATALTELHKRVLARLTDDDPDGAAAYYAQHQSEILGTERASIERALEVGSLRKRAQAATDELTSLPLSEALSEARKRFSGELEDEVVRRLRDRAAERDAIRERGERALADAAWNAFAQGGREAIPTPVWAGLDGRTRLAIEREAEARAAGRDVATDWETFYALRTMATDQPGRFAALDLRQHFDKLAPGERRALIGIQQSLSKPGDQYDAAALNRQLTVMHNIMGWRTSKRDLEARGRFDAAALSAISAEQQRLGRKLSQQERQSILDALVVEGTVDAPWWNPRDERRVFELTDEFRDTFVPSGDIPPTERAKIEAALKRAGVPVTDDAIRELYTRRLRQLSAIGPQARLESPEDALSPNAVRLMLGASYGSGDLYDYAAMYAR